MLKNGTILPCDCEAYAWSCCRRPILATTNLRCTCSDVYYVFLYMNVYKTSAKIIHHLNQLSVCFTYLCWSEEAWSSFQFPMHMFDPSCFLQYTTDQFWNMEISHLKHHYTEYRVNVRHYVMFTIHSSCITIYMCLLYVISVMFSAFTRILQQFIVLTGGKM